MIELITDNLTFPELPADERFAAFVDTTFPNAPDDVRFCEAGNLDVDFPRNNLTLASVRVTDGGYAVRDYVGTHVSEEATPEGALLVVEQVIRERLPKDRQARLDRKKAADMRLARGASFRALIHKRAKEPTATAAD